MGINFHTPLKNPKIINKKSQQPSNTVLRVLGFEKNDGSQVGYETEGIKNFFATYFVQNNCYLI